MNKLSLTLACVLLFALSAIQVHAGIIVNIAEVGANVRLSYGAGTLDTSGLSNDTGFSSGAVLMHGAGGLIGGGPISDGDVFTGNIVVTKSSGWTLGNGITLFSSTTGVGGLFGSEQFANIGTVIGISDQNAVPPVVGINNILGASGTINNTTLAALGLTPNESITFRWDADFLTFTTVPEPTSFLMFGTALLAGTRRRRVA